jgi:RimJ/RimL family protein N-acetyltransferase
MQRVNIPVIETSRLRLRGHRAADLADCVSMWADPSVTKFITGKPSTETQTWARLLAYVGHWSLMNFGYWAIEEKASSAFVGELGFADFRRDVIDSMKGNPELGFALVPAFHGKGYATEAVEAAHTWADAHLPYTRTVCMTNTRNVPSLRVVKKCGYDVFEEGLYNDQPVVFLFRDQRR